MNRSRVCSFGLVWLLALLALPGSPAIAAEPFDVVEATVDDMPADMTAGRLTSRELVALHLQRIALFEDKLHAAITVNPRALEEAEALDRERASGRVRGPLHGVPIAIKDNIQTRDLPTSVGALVF